MSGLVVHRSSFIVATSSRIWVASSSFNTPRAAHVRTLKTCAYRVLRSGLVVHRSSFIVATSSRIWVASSSFNTPRATHVRTLKACAYPVRVSGLVVHRSTLALPLVPGLPLPDSLARVPRMRAR